MWSLPAPYGAEDEAIGADDAAAADEIGAADDAASDAGADDTPKRPVEGVFVVGKEGREHNSLHHPLEQKRCQGEASG